MTTKNNSTAPLDRDLHLLQWNLNRQKALREGITCNSGLVRYDYEKNIIEIRENSGKEKQVALTQIHTADDILRLLSNLSFSRKQLEPEIFKVTFEALWDIIEYHFGINIASSDLGDWNLKWDVKKIF